MKNVVKINKDNYEIDAVTSASPQIAKGNYGIFEHREFITFRYITPEQNVSHDKFAELFGVARERFGLEYIPNFAHEAGNKYMLKTRSAHYEYTKDFVFGDTMLIKMYVTEVTAATFTLKAQFINELTGEIHTIGEQVIVYANMQGHPQRFPREFKQFLFGLKEVGLKVDSVIA